MQRTIAHVALAFILYSVDGPLNGAEPVVIFNRDVRPILSNKCYKCHGPDATQRPSDLRLDNQAIAIAELDSGVRAVVPGVGRSARDHSTVSTLKGQG